MRVLFLCTLFLVAFFFPLLCFSEEIPVKEIHIKGLHASTKEEFLDVLGITPPANVTREVLSMGIKRLFRKGIFEDISVSYEPKVLIFEVKERRIIHNIIFKGNRNVPDSALEKVVPFKYGDIFRPEALDELKKLLKKRLSELGFLKAEVAVKVKEQEPPFVDILCHINEGPPAIMKQMKIEITPPVSEIDQWDLKLMMRTTPENPLEHDTLVADMEKIRAFFQKLGYPLVYLEEPVFKDGILKIKVYPGPKYLIEVSGNKAFRTTEIKEGAGFDRLKFYSQKEFETLAYRIKRFYTRHGYIEASVRLDIIYSPREIKVIYRIHEGPFYRVKEVAVEGGPIPPKRLLKILYLQKGSPFNPETVKKDISILKGFYSSLGYRDVEISQDIQFAAPHEVSVKYKIKPGPVYIISEVKLDGNRSLSDETLVKAFGIKPGHVYNELDLEEGRRTIQRLYESRGFLDAIVRLKPDFKDTGVVVTIVISEGPRYTFGKLIIKGNLDTHYSVIKRKVPFKEGQPVNPELLPEMVRDLYATGLFSNVNTQFVDAEERVKDLLVEVEEAPAGTIELSFGYGEYEKLRGAIELRYLNLFGKNRTGSIRLEANTLKRAVQVSYRDPYFFEPDVELLSRLRIEHERFKNFDTGELNYKAKKYSGTVGLQKPLTAHLTGSISYEYSLVETYDINPDVVLSEKDRGYLAIESLILAITYDRRDNPFNPSKGMVAGLSIKNASSYLLGQTDFVKVTGSLSKYFRLSSPLVIAAGLRTGIAYGYRQTKELPIVERFFLGGRNSVRGFPQDSLGPTGPDGNPTGGNAFIQGNLELRLRILSNLGIVGFLDGGNVWRTVDEMNMDLRYSAGVGLRYNTPAGPIRLDYGWKLDVQPGESPGEFHFSIGHAF